jgi:DNA (cytosine-5)-methyltransferase 1
MRGMMRYLSVCSGIEAASVAWEPLGWQPAGFAEIETFPAEVLSHHYPGVRNYGDMTKYKEWSNVGSVDILVGGTPCQSFSVAGFRGGLKDPRGNLMLTYGAIADHFKPTWLVWENVPGVLSSNRGRDFGVFLGMLAELGYGFAYRILDAQYYGVAQRRRRVFVISHLGDWRAAAAVLFESASLCGHTPPSRKKGQGFAAVAGTLAANGGGTTRPAGNGNELDICVPAIMAHGQANAEIRQDGGATSLTCNHEAPIVSYGIPGNWISRKPENGGNATKPMYDVAPCLTGADKHGVSTQSTVRRLTPIECERLQGFPDNYTNIKPSCPDGPRYRALGNSMAVPVMHWIGERIKQSMF